MQLHSLLLQYPSQRKTLLSVPLIGRTHLILANQKCFDDSYVAWKFPAVRWTRVFRPALKLVVIDLLYYRKRNIQKCQLLFRNLFYMLWRRSSRLKNSLSWQENFSVCHSCRKICNSCQHPHKKKKRRYNFLRKNS